MKKLQFHPSYMALIMVSYTEMFRNAAFQFIVLDLHIWHSAFLQSIPC